MMRWYRTLRRGRRLWRDRRGNLTVEMAFIAPLILISTLGVVDIGQGVWTVSALDQAARVGARYAAIHGPNADRLGWTADDAEIKNVIREAYVGLGADDILDSDINVVYQHPSRSPGTLVTVTIAVDFHFITYGGLTGSTVTLTGESNMTMM